MIFGRKSGKQTVREWFTNHPDFRPTGGLEPGPDDKTVLYCGVPITAEVWKLLKAGNLDAPMPDEKS